MPRLLAALACLAIAAAACGGQAGSTTPDLSGTWVLTDSTTPEGPITVPADARIDLHFEDGQVGGVAACNSYFGEATVEGDQITLGNLGQTEMACDEPRMTAERRYLEALARVTTISREDDTLTLAGDGVELAYSLEPPTPDASLAGTTWQLDTLVEGDAASTVLGDIATLELDDDGTFTAGTGCRQLNGSWSLDGDRVDVAEVSVDDRACPAELQRQDELVTRVLSSEFTVAIDGTRLTVMTGDEGLGYAASPSD